MTSPPGRRLAWAQLSAPLALPAAVAAVARGNKGVPATRDSPPSLLMPPPTFPTRGVGHLPPPWARLQAPLSPCSHDQAPDPSLLPVDPLPTPPHRVRQPSEPVRICAPAYICVITLGVSLPQTNQTKTDTTQPSTSQNFYISHHCLFGRFAKLHYILKGNYSVPPNKRVPSENKVMSEMSIEVYCLHGLLQDQ